ncbi:methyltransferase [Verrucomicrobium sp. BvORR034]|uniref:methyltransferase n=1 Tax=Verrucomicrobium sp. BvORR034 TaxID=1396418 RepID=UPI0006793A98|nr:methyltransferase [Verrucomicrobium sp. BvORR034]
MSSHLFSSAQSYAATGWLFMQKWLRTSFITLLFNGLVTWLAVRGFKLSPDETKWLIGGVVVSTVVAYFISAYRGISCESGNFLGGHHFVPKSKKVDMIATNFQGFEAFEKNVRAALRKSDAHVRILLLDPRCSSFAERMIQYGPTQSPRAFAEAFKSALYSLECIDRDLQEWTRSQETTGTLQWQLYSKAPTKGTILTEHEVRYWPYFSTMHQSSSPTLTMRAGHALAAMLREDFENLWNDKHTQPGRILRSCVRYTQEQAAYDIEHVVRQVEAGTHPVQQHPQQAPHTDWPWPQAWSYVRPSSSLPAPSRFAQVLAEALPTDASATLLDIGCGSGIIGIFSLLEHGVKSVTFNDVQSEALAEVAANLARHFATRAITPQQTALHHGAFTDIPLQTVKQHTHIAFNPPQFPVDLADPAEVERIQQSGPENIFRHGGRDGLEIVRQFLAWLSSLQADRPVTYLMLSSFLGQKAIEDAFTAASLPYLLKTTRTAPLRRSLHASASRFKDKPEELADRRLKQADGSWQKKLLVYEIPAA